MNGASLPSRRASLRSVMARANLAVAFLAVGLAGISLTVLGVLALRVYADHNLQLIARSINYTVEAALVFNDRPAANEALALIASREQVAEALVFKPNGDLFAQWKRPQRGVLAHLDMHLARALLQEPINQPIEHQGRIIGYVHLTGHSASLLRFMLSGLLGILLCTALSALAAQYLSRRLLNGIVGPLRGLAEVAHAARRDRAFERRVPAVAITELNDLGSDFNALLAELQTWQKHWQRENKSLAHQATHDSLTGLPNRTFFEGRLGRHLVTAQASQQRLAVLFIDSDRFKSINDTYGHAAGDEVLIHIATRIRGLLREHDLVARLGGDEFAVLLSPLPGLEEAQRIAEQIIHSMAEPVRVGDGDGEYVDTSLSVGIAVFPDHGHTPAQLLAAADLAMYGAKRVGRGRWHAAGLETADDLDG